MKNTYRKSLPLILTALAPLSLATSVYAQSPDTLLAYHAPNAASDADAEIFAAMQALDEVGSLLDNTAPKTDNPPKNTQLPATNADDLNALLAAADTQSTRQAPVAPKHDLQNANNGALNAKQDNTVVKHDLQNAGNAKAEVKPSSAIAHDGTRTTSQPQKKVAPHVNANTSLAYAYVRDVYKLNGVDLAEKLQGDYPTIGDLYQYAFKQKLVYQTTRPAIGDLVFFHNTFDRNRDGRWNDWHTLVGIVESIDDNDTISILIYTTKIEKIELNLKYPELKTRKGQTLNTQIRPDEGGQVGTTAKLFAGFANLLGDIPSVTVIDNWQPGMKIK